MSTGGGAARRGPVLASSGGAGSSTGSSGVVPALPAGRRARPSAGRGRGVGGRRGGGLRRGRRLRRRFLGGEGGDEEEGEAGQVARHEVELGQGFVAAAAEEGFERSVVEDGLQGERGRDEDVARAPGDAGQGGRGAAAAG